MSPGSETIETPARVDVVLCIDDPTLRQFRAALRHLCVGLIDAAVQVRVVTPSLEAEVLTLGGVQVVLHKALSWPWKRHTLHELVEALEDRPPGVVHAFGAGSFDLAHQVAAHFDADLVLQVLGFGDVDHLGDLPREAVGRVIAASQPLWDRLTTAGIIPAEALSLIRPGIIAGDGAACFNEPERTPTVLCTSQFFAQSGVGSLLEAVRILLGRGHEFLTFLTGAGPEEESLRRLVRSYGLASAVTFANPTGDPRRIMAGADIFVRPDVERWLSVRLLQALGTGTATIALEGGAGDACIHDETALVCPDARPSTLAAAMERLLTDPDYARALAGQGMKHIKKHHSVSAMSSALLQVYQDLALRGRTLTA